MEQQTSESWQFQFTPLHERQHISVTSIVICFYLNSRLYMRGSLICTISTTIATYFNSRLYMRGSLCCQSSLPQTDHFNSRLYMRGSRLHFRAIRHERKFQFTPLHERQHSIHLFDVALTDFNSRLYMRGSIGFRIAECADVNFNSRLYMRGSTFSLVNTF